MPYATYRFNKIIATETIRFIVTVAIVVYKGLKLVVYRMLTIELNHDLKRRLRELHFQPRQRALTPLQYEAIIKYLGDPGE